MTDFFNIYRNFVIIEGYKEAKAKFIKDGANPEEVNQILDTHKKLKDLRRLPSEYININVIQKQGLPFIKNIISKYNIDTKLEKKAKLTNNIVYRDNEYTIYLPNSIEEIRQLGHSPNADWCIANGDINDRKMMIERYMNIIQPSTEVPNIFYIAKRNKLIKPDDGFNMIAIQAFQDGKYQFTKSPNSGMQYNWPNNINILAKSKVRFRQDIYSNFKEELKYSLENFLTKEEDENGNIIYYIPTDDFNFANLPDDVVGDIIDQQTGKIKINWAFKNNITTDTDTNTFTVNLPNNFFLADLESIPKNTSRILFDSSTRSLKGLEKIKTITDIESYSRHLKNEDLQYLPSYLISLMIVNTKYLTSFDNMADNLQYLISLYTSDCPNISNIDKLSKYKSLNIIHIEYPNKITSTPVFNKDVHIRYKD